MFKHILVPLDGSKLAENAIPTALELASHFDGEITLLRVVQPPHLLLANVTGTAYAELFTSLRDQAIEEANTYLKALQSSLLQQGYKIHLRVIEGEPVAEVLLSVVDTIGTDIIVMSTHGRGGISRWVFGSVADKVLQFANVPILLIRTKGTDLDWELPEP